uniref:alpha-amylase family glycosyl hydrolase n=1 Tax=Segatella hominis TaxID=2518605 RepID=UPI004027E752
MRRFTKKIWAALLLLLVSMQSMATDVFTSNRTDFRDESIYFMITTRFYDGDPKNNVLCWDNQEAQMSTKDPCWRGDFQGVIDKLDYIKALGFTAIWITPVVQNASGYDYHGYHASDFSKVDCRYQSGDGKKSGDVMFQELIDKAHAKGIKIILDIVLNHTGNFGEEHFCKEFDRDTRLRNQADINACMIPNLETLGSDYPTLQPGSQYQRRLAMMKNTDGQNHDPHNYWHHFGNFNWDLPNRWWAQIAGDCVDLNTENNTVAEYLVKCYGNFIKMGVDGFRIDTSGHISRLTFCKQFIPQFAALGKQYENKRLNKAPFFMYGEVCTRGHEATYRGQANLSCYFYTWKSDESLMNQWDGSQSFWDSQVLPEGSGPIGPQALCGKETFGDKKSENAKMINGAWHEPDYSEASGFNVIDFPMHYSYNTAKDAFRLSAEDELYNDATYNVVYIDSHDYSPGPNDLNRFGGTDAQWAENLSLLFTFRGIPCIYYGSEVGFRRGVVIDKGPNGPLSNTGRAYFGGYITGDVEASDFGEYQASGNVAATLNHDVAQHLIRLNKIRQAVPALRKGQWTSDGCTPANGGIAFKRAYKDSYALVALNGGATFTDCPAGTYTDLVTGKTYTGSTITVDAPNNQGQVRVLVKDWKGGKLIEDGAFIYASAAQHQGDQTYDGQEEAGTTWIEEAPIQPASVSLSPAGGSFRTNTVTVTATLSEDAVSGWYQIEGQNKVDLTPGKSVTFTIGEGMNFNDTKTVTWSASSSDGKEKTGSATYKKVDPNASVTVTVKATNAPHIHAWTTGADGKDLTGAWPGKVMDGPVVIDGANYWTYSFDGVENFNVILNNGNGAQSGDITGITGDIYLEYDGGTSAKKIDAPVNTAAQVTFSPNGGEFEKTVTVTATLSNNAKSGWYKIGNGEQVNLTPGKAASFTLGADMQEGESQTVTWSATNAEGVTKTGSAQFNKKKVDPNAAITIYVKATNAPYVYTWTTGTEKQELTGAWPGKVMSDKENIGGEDYWTYTFDGVETINAIFNTGNGGQQTGDIIGICEDIFFKYDGGSNAQKIDAPVNTAAQVTFSPNGGEFEKTVTVTATLSNNAKSGWYKIGNGEQVNLTPGKAATFTLGADMQEGESQTVTWSATNAEGVTKTGSAQFNKKKVVVIPTPTGIFAYFIAPSDWTDVHAYAWNGSDEYAGGWPGVSCTKTGEKKNGLDVWMWKYDGDKTELPTNIIFNNNGNGNNQTGDFEFVNGAVYDRSSSCSSKANESFTTGINQVGSKKAPAKLKIYSINGQKVAEVGSMADAEYILAPGVYVCGGKKYVIK